MITTFGTNDFHWNFLVLFSGPVLSTGGMIFYQARRTKTETLALKEAQLEILPILKLSGFILAVLALSKILQKAFGQAGLLVLTFFVSLFEVHGSVIANLQLHDAGVISVKFLGGLLTASIVASYLSKLFLVVTLGSSALKKTVTKSTLFLFLSLGVSGAIFYFSA